MASQQPPLRPWLRPAPAPIPQPRPAFARPAFAQTFRPPIAQPQLQLQPTQPRGPGQSPPPPPAAAPPATLPTPPTAAVPTSPITKTSATSASLPTSPVPKVIPVQSSSVPPSPKPKILATSSSLSSSSAPPPPSAMPAASTTVSTAILTSPRLLAKTPSALALPPAQMKSETGRYPEIPAETEQKTVLVQETIGKSKAMPMTSNGDVGATHNSNFGKEGIKSRDKVILKKFSDSEEFGTGVITIAGENKGAIMELTPSRKKYGFGHDILQKKDNPNSEDLRLKMKDKSNKTSPSPPWMATFLNSNVQGVNNSIVYNVSDTCNDPGVHISFPTKGARGGGGNGSHFNDKHI